MTPEKIRQQAAALAEIYAAVANGKTLQAKSTHGWRDVSGEHGPSMCSSLHCYRIKPEPRTVWLADSSVSGLAHVARTPEKAEELRQNLFTVTEWKEALP
jgi:hypothetical protein